MVILRKGKNYTTISISWENRILLGDIKRFLQIEEGRFIDMNEVISWLIEQVDIS